MKAKRANRLARAALFASMKVTMSKFPFGSPPDSRRAVPTLRALLRGGGRRGRSTRSPFYAGYPARAQIAFTQRLKRQ